MTTPGLQVLLTNTYLIQRAGTELYIRDIAIGLLRRGHTPIVYSPRLGEVAEEIRAATVPVVDSLDALGVRPDLIHGQHHLEAMTALLRFPDTPAVFFSHGWLPWQEAPPRFPRILQYVAVSQAIRDRLIHEHAIDPERVSLILNFVDLGRFRPRPGLPPRPRRALLFGNYATETYRRAVAAACADRAITLDVAGSGLGTPTDRPEALLPQYDLVFAVGRAALEAITTGAAVILASPDGLGPLVTTANLDHLRRLNFGLRALAQPCDQAHIVATIDGYEAADAHAVSEQLRAEAGLDRALDRIVQLYEEVVTRWSAAPRDPAAEARATADYLGWLSRYQLQNLIEDHQRQAASLTQLHDQCAGLRRELAALEREVAASRGEVTASQADLAAVRAEILAIRGTRGWQALEMWWRVKHRVSRKS